MQHRMLPLLLVACAGPVDPGHVVSIVDHDAAGELDDAPEPFEPGSVDTEVPAEEEPAAFHLGPVVRCADPSARAERPFDVVLLPGEPAPPDGLRLVGGAVVVTDLDGDGDDDVLLPGVARTELIERDDDGTWISTAEDRLAPGLPLDHVTAAVPGDLDGDGDLDLVIGRWQRPLAVLLQDGGVFVDGTEASGILGDARTQALGLGDADADGDLDLVVGSYGPTPDTPSTGVLPDGDPTRLWRNHGDGTFEEVVDGLPERFAPGFVFAAAWQDLDGDLRPELLLLRDFGWVVAGLTAWNRPEGLVADDGAANLDHPFAGMGLGLGDVDGDGLVDLAQSSYRQTSLLVSYGAPRWWEVGAARGVRVAVPRGDGDPSTPVQFFGWGTELVDLDLDGDLDLPMVFGSWDEFDDRRLQPDALFEQDEDGLFSDRALAWGFADTGVARGLATGDLNADGFPDLVVRRLGAPTLAYVSRCDDGAWLRVRLHGPGAVGARVTARGGGRTFTRWTRAGGTGMYGASTPDALFGLAGLDTVDVEVAWPGGDVTTVERVGTRRQIDVDHR